MQHRTKVVILGHIVLLFVIEAEITRQAGFTICPQQGNQVDSLDNLSVLARPVTRDQRHLPGIEFVQRGVVNNQQALTKFNQRLYLRPQCFAIRPNSVQQTGVGIMRWSSPAGCVLDASTALNAFWAATKKLM